MHGYKWPINCTRTRTAFAASDLGANVDGTLGLGWSAALISEWSAAAGLPWDDETAELWLDSQTRVVIVDFTVHNPTKEILTAVKLVVEVTATGQLVPTASINTMRVRPLFDSSSFVSWCEWALLVLVVLAAAWRCFVCALQSLHGHRVRQLRYRCKRLNPLRSSQVIGHTRINM